LVELMNAFWNSNPGKLLAAGCGTQVGLALASVSLVGVLLFCFVCALSNALVVGLTQEMAGLPGPVSTGAAASGEVESLLSQVKFLQGEVDFLRTNEAPGSLAAQPADSTPRAMASQSGVNLRTGPGLDYPKVGLLPLGSSLEIVGRNMNASWWLVSTPDGFAWVSNEVVTTRNVGDSIPVVTIPSLLVQPAAASNSAIVLPDTGTSAMTTPTPALPVGTPIPGAAASRQFVEDMPAYKRLRGHLLVPPVSASLSPDGSQIAITERIKLYTVTTGGALSRVWLEDNDTLGPLGDIVWSPDGQYLAFMVGFKTPKCRPCRSVALLSMADESMTFLEAPNGLDTDMPRWTEDGRLLINVHPGEPADGTAYVYDTSGHGEVAAGTYVLSSSHEGQKWYPWQPGKTWQVGLTERADSYNSD
jgi:uncharacterized protein YraI